MLHITNGDATRVPLERSGVPGTVASWDDVLHEGPTPLASGEEWWRVRARYLASAGYGDEAEMLEHVRAKGDPLDAAAAHDEVVFWFEHDLHDQLLVVRHLWWLSRWIAGSEDPACESGRSEDPACEGGRSEGQGSGRREGPSRPRFSIVIGTDYLGLLKPEEFPARFAARRAITAEEIEVGAAIWKAFCGDDPRRLVSFASDAGPLRYVPRAMHRLLEEFPAAKAGLARSERQILEVLSEGPRSPGQAFVACAKLEDDIWMGDWSFWAIVRRMASAAPPLVAADVQRVEDRFPEGILTITAAGRQVLAGDADYLALNAPSRWIGGTYLTPQRAWRWTGSSLLPPAP